MELYHVLFIVAATSCGLAQAQITCGYELLDTTSQFIVGGSAAMKGEFPWQVGMQQRSGSSYNMICGATLVTDGTVLKVITAAHCIGSTNAGNYRLLFGLHLYADAAKVGQSGGPTDVVAVVPTRVIPHPNYNDNQISNDIAIFELPSGFSMSSLAGITAAPACLPSRDATDNEFAKVSGWGTTRSGSQTYPTELQFVAKNIITKAECENTGNGGYLDNSMICAGERGKDACQGDSGGPMVSDRHNGYELVGVVSWGFGCGRDNYPGVYADVYKLRPFVCQHFSC